MWRFTRNNGITEDFHRKILRMAARGLADPAFLLAGPWNRPAFRAAHLSHPIVTKPGTGSKYTVTHHDKDGELHPHLPRAFSLQKTRLEKAIH